MKTDNYTNCKGGKCKRGRKVLKGAKDEGK